MPKYGGGHEDFKETESVLRKLREERQALTGAEVAGARAATGSASAEAEAAAASRLKAGAKREAAQVEERASRVTRTSTQATELDTAAVRANTAARQRANQVRAMGDRAVYGARSPQYAQAHQLYEQSGTIPSQYRLRQIEGVGQRRAAAMVQAMQAGLKPSTGGDYSRPLTRLNASHEALAAAQYRLAQASKEHERILRSGTEADAQKAYAARQAAKLGQDAARQEVKDAQTAHGAAVARVAEDQRNQKRILTERLRQIRETPLIPGQKQLVAAGQTTQGMPVYAAQTRTAVPLGQRALPPAGGTTPGMPVQQAEVRTMRVQQLALPPAGGTTQGMPLQLAQTRTAVPRPPLTPPPPGPNFVAGNAQRQAAILAAAQAQRVLDGQAAATQRVAAANVQAGASFYPLSQAMHRHGALTSEFIAAAARGEVTMRELGRQAVITAGKFGGWAVAAAAVYGVVGALAQVGKGAKDASTGADQAFRVITKNRDRGQLQGDFSALSEKFNVPIADAADAVYRMGQVFHDQGQATKAAEASLLSYKTGQVSVEDSTKNLIAIQRGFGLSADQLVGIFDQINQAQNTFGVSIGNVESGLARAGGTWRNAGGDLSYLLAIMVAVQKATGETGTTIGTSLSRLYYVQHPQSAQKLRNLGVDVDLQNAQSTFESIRKKAQEPGADIQALASGFAGNQYARLYTGLLKDQKTFNDALRETGAEASKGSGMKELSRVLSQVDEQLHALGFGLQQIGVELGKAGAFQIFGLMLKGMNSVLDVTKLLLQTFNLIPGPLRQTLVIIGEIALALALLRKLGATERFANTRLGFLADPVGRQRTHTIAGLRQGQTEAYNRTERAGVRVNDAAFRSSVDRQLANEAGARYRAVQNLDTRDPRRIALHNQLMLAEQQARDSEVALAQANRELTAARLAATRAEQELIAAQATTRRTFMAAAGARGWPYPRGLDQPNMQGTAGAPGTVVTPGGAIVPIRGPGGSTAASSYTPTPVPRFGPGGSMPAGAWVPPVGPGGTAAATSAAGAAAAARNVTASQRFITQRLRTVETNARLMGSTGALMGQAATRTASVARLAGGGLARGAAGLRSAGAALASLGAMLGPLDILLIGIIGAMIFKSKLDKALANANKLNTQLQAPTRTTEAVQAQQATADRVLATQQKALSSSGLGRPGTQNQSTYQWLKSGGLSNSVSALWNNFTGATDAAKEARDNFQRQMEVQARAAKEGKPRPFLTIDQLEKDIKETADLRKKGLISQKEADERLALNAKEQQTLLDASKQSLERARQAQADAQRSIHGTGYRQSLLDMPADEFAKEMQGQAAAIELFGLTPHNLDFLKQQYQAAEQKWRNSNDPEALIALNQARQAYFGAIINEVNQELQLQLLQASNEYERRAAYSQAEDAYEKARVTMKQQNTRMRAAMKKQRDDLKAKQTAEDAGGGQQHQRQIGEDSPQGGVYKITEDEVTEREDRQRKERIKLTRDQKRKINKELERQNRELTLAQLQLKQQAYDDRQQGRQILLNLQIAGTQDPLRQSVLRVEAARRQVADAQREWGTNSRAYRQALTDLRNAQVQQAQAVVAGVEADNAILIAKAGDDPAARARAEADAAQRVLDTMRTQGHQDPNAVKQQEARVIDAKRAATDASNQQQQDLVRLRGELAEARAGGDPVVAARAAIEAARLARQVADTPVERLQALVDLAKANNQLQEALAQRERVRTDLLKSQTDDPVEQARLDMQAAANALKGAKGYDKMQKQADYNNAQRAYQDAKIADRVDTINFEQQMDQITADEAAKQLEALANMKGISKQKKRELLLQAKQLRDEASGDYELDVGSIRLPSLYEVRRFVQGGQTNASQIVTDNRSFVVNLGSAEAVNAFASQLELTNGSSAKATARSMQMR